MRRSLVAPVLGGISTLQGGIVLKKRNTRNLQQALLQMTQENTRKKFCRWRASSLVSPLFSKSCLSAVGNTIQ